MDDGWRGGCVVAPQNSPNQHFQNGVRVTLHRNWTCRHFDRLAFFTLDGWMVNGWMVDGRIDGWTDDG